MVKKRKREKTPKTTRTRRVILSLSVIAAVALLVYSNSLYGPFLTDDEAYILNNPKVRGLGNFLDLSGSRYVAFLSFAVNYAVSGYSPFGYHLVNLLIHTANGLLVFLLVLMTFDTPAMKRSGMGEEMGAGEAGGAVEVKYFIALCTALVFVSHPVQTQAVAYITQRFASLATLFYLLSLVLFVRWRINREGPGSGKRPGLYLLSLASAVLAMKTKEISFTLPFIIVLYEFAFFTGKGDFKERVFYLAPLVPFIVTLVIVPMGLLSPGEGGVDERLRESQLRDLTTIPRYDYLITQLSVVTTYLRLMVYPEGQQMYYDYPVFRSFFEPAVFLSFLFLSSVAGLAVYLFIRSRRTANAYGLLISFGVLWFFITLGVESSVNPIKDVIAEHRMYLPGAGLFMAFTASVSYLFFTFRQNPVGAWAVMSVIVVLLSVAAHKRNYVWGDRLAFWLDEAGKSPARAEVHNGLGSAYYDTGRYEEAAAEYERAIVLAPGYAHAHNNLAMVYKALGMPEKAIEHLHAAISLTPGLAGAHYNLANVLSDLGMTEDAVESYKSALSLDPDLAPAHYFLGKVYAGQGRTEEALKEFEAVLEIRPDDKKARKALESLTAR